MECSSCGLLRLHPWPAPGELGNYYPKTYWFAPGASIAARLEEQYRRLVLRDHVGFVEATLRTIPAGPVLDIGCGGALLGRMLRETGRQCLGMDFSTEAAAVAWSANGVPVAVGDFHSAPFPDGSFAAVTMFHVLEHLYDPVRSITAIGRLVRPDGRLIIQVPNAASWQFRLFGERWNGIDVPRHLVNYRASDLKEALRRCGFEVVREKHFSLRDNPAGLATTIAPDLDPMARRVRGAGETGGGRLLRDLTYLVLVGLALPFSALEAAFGAGSSIMVEARKRPS